MPGKPTRLRCEYRENPLGIDTPRPRLSWNLDSTQSAYQIVANSGADLLWDSEQVSLSSSIHIDYAGKPLQSVQRITWKVRVWDREGASSDWSEPANWTMGIVSANEWLAKWITAPVFEDSKRMPIFRKTFALDKPIARAVAFFCGLGQHELHLNGQVVGQDVIDPGWTNYKKTCLYATHDVTSMLKRGQNVVGMMLGNGMYNVVGGRYTKFKGSFGPPKLIAQLHVEFADGSSTTIVSDESWQAAPGPITFSCIYGGEDYDARLEQPGWDSPRVVPSPGTPGEGQGEGSSASATGPSPQPSPGVPGEGAEMWRPAIVSDDPGGVLRSQAQPPIRVMQTFAPVKITEPKPGAKVYDLAQNMSGRPKISLRADAGSLVTLKTGELLNPDGQVSQKHIGSPVSFSYTCRGGEIETWNPRFSYHGFRYVQAEGTALSGLSEVAGQFTHSSAAVVGKFECSDEMLNKIHGLIDMAILSNMQSVLTDCPQREKLGWLEESHLMAPAILFNYDAPLLYEKICRDMREAQYDNGFVPAIAPQYTVFGKTYSAFNDSPEWGSASVINPWLIYQRFGDRRILEENYEMMKAYVEYLHGKENEGIIEWGLGDWYDIGPKGPGVSQLTSLGVTGTAIYYFDAVVMRRTAELLGKREDADRFKSHADRICAAFNAKFFDSSKKQYDRNSQTASAMPLALGMVDPENRDAVLENLVADIRAHNNHITAGDIGFLYVVRALAEGGRSDVIFDLLKRSDPPSYGSQLARGATTLTEAWDANSNSSQNHLMLGHAEIWFYEYLAGIQIDLSKPPGEQLVIRPAIVGDIAWVKASYQSMLGPIACQWERSGNAGKLTVAIPGNVEATIHLPNTPPRTVGSGQHAFEFSKT